MRPSRRPTTRPATAASSQHRRRPPIRAVPPAEPASAFRPGTRTPHTAPPPDNPPMPSTASGDGLAACASSGDQQHNSQRGYSPRRRRVAAIRTCGRARRQCPAARARKRGPQAAHSDRGQQHGPPPCTEASVASPACQVDVADSLRRRLPATASRHDGGSEHRGLRARCVDVLLESPHGTAISRITDATCSATPIPYRHRSGPGPADSELA